MRVALLALILSLSLCASAYAEEAAPTVGAPTVITEPAAEIGDATAGELTDGDTAEEDAPDDGPAPAGPKRGELHVLGTSATQSPAPQAAAAPAAPPRAQAAANTLPFTGIDAWQLALAGCALLAAGLATRRLSAT